MLFLRHLPRVFIVLGPHPRGALGPLFRRRGGGGGDKEPLPVESIQVPLRSSFVLPSWADFGRFARAAHEGRRESSEVFLKCCLASACEDKVISAKSMSIACLCVCAEMSVNTPWLCVFCVRLSTLSGTSARSTPLEDERHDEMNMHAKSA